jgi:hypothetical protein
MCSSAYHAIMIITCPRIRCAVHIFTYTIASYRIAEGSVSSSTRGTDRGRPIGNPGIGGARGRGAKREPARVRGSST